MQRERACDVRVVPSLMADAGREESQTQHVQLLSRPCEGQSLQSVSKVCIWTGTIICCMSMLKKWLVAVASSSTHTLTHAVEHW